MIISVSTLTSGMGAATPVSLVNLSIERPVRLRIDLSPRFTQRCGEMQRVAGGAEDAADDASDDVELAEWTPRLYSFVAESAAIHGAIGSVDDQFGKRLADGRPLLQAVAGKAIGEDEVGDPRVGPYDAVLIERVVVVVAGPGTPGANGFEGRNADRERGPDSVVEQRPVGFEIVST